MFTKKRFLKFFVFLFALLLSPMICATIGLSISVFANNNSILSLGDRHITVENKTALTLYVTPVTEAYSEPRVIEQTQIRLKNFEIQPGKSIELLTGNFDFPLSGLVVCEATETCRALRSSQDVLTIQNYNTLGEVPESWLNAHQQQPIIDISFVLYPLLGMLSISLFILGACIDFKQ
ncbi:MAG: hypothetical protein AAF902_25950 [Chloroflexota bacterium]